MSSGETIEDSHGTFAASWLSKGHVSGRPRVSACRGKLLSGHRVRLRPVCLGILNDLEVTADVGLSHARLGIERRDDQQLQSELLEQVECILGMLVIDF